MKFGEYLKNNILPEWADFYMNYKALKTLLAPFKKFYQAKIIKKNKSELNLAKTEEKMMELNYFQSPPADGSSFILNMEKLVGVSPEDEVLIQRNFMDMIFLEMNKFLYFFTENYSYYCNRLIKIRNQLNYVKKNKHFISQKEDLEMAVKELYKESNLMKSFIELNLKAKLKIMKKFKKYTKFSSKNLDVYEKVEQFSESQNLKEKVKVIVNLIVDIEKVFQEHFVGKYSYKTSKILKEYISPQIFTELQSFYFGFFVGIIIVLAILCLIIAFHFNIDMDDDHNFRQIFPMFRGYCIFCIYFWLLGLNVFAWNKVNINYKLCFSFGNHYSDIISIFKRAAVFSAVFVLMVLAYMVIRTDIPIIVDFFYIIPLELTPLICWLTLLVYMLFPRRDFFNYLGRFWFFKLLLESFLGLFIKVDFKHVWFTDQLTSFIGPMRDMEYTYCYYSNFEASSQERARLCSSGRGIVLFLGVFPHILRIFQCLRIIYDTGKLLPQSLNIVKYGMAILVAVISSMAHSPFYRSLWWIVALISTFYSYFWDIKMDFGFLQPYSQNYPLRDKLSYQNKGFYYFCISVNMFLRFMWALTVSPEVVYRFIRPEFLSFLIYSMEVLRRGMWNFIRVELKHIELCKEFRVTVDVELPFKKIGQEFVPKKTNLIDFVNKKIQRIDNLKASFRFTERETSKSGIKYETPEFRNALNSFIQRHKEKFKKLTINYNKKNSNISGE